MKIETRRSVNKAVAFVALFCTVMQPTYALTLTTEPLFLANRIAPKVMLALSKDQQLYKKAYNDYSDLDGDNVAETTYKHAITYYGYFDPTKCYDYANDRYEPKAVTTYTVTVGGTTKTGSAYCDDSTGRWSGNFLNWVSMARMDAVKKLLYGGTRSTDSATDTVLERVHLPIDAHAWAKYYNGADIARLTPFAPPTTTTSYDLNTLLPVLVEKKNQDLFFALTSATTWLAKGDQLKMQVRGTPGSYMIGTVMDFAFIPGPNVQNVRMRVNEAGVSGEGVLSSQWTLTDLSSTGISFCNLTLGTAKSQGNTNPPLIRVAAGNFALWNANEAKQCLWFDERNGGQAGFGGIGSNGNQASLSEMNASAENPSQVTHGLGRTGSDKGQYNVRVQACVASLVGTEKCQKYGTSLKPVGLLQTYGDVIDFGLMTGSYTKNISGGVLRKGVGPFTDEVNAADGTFVSSVNGIVKTLNAMRIYGFNYPSGDYLGSAGDDCTYQLTNITENSCTSWGNPMSEIYYEAIRYFAAKTDNQATPAYTYTDSGSKDNTLGLSLAPWKAPMTEANACAKLNVLVFNASVSTNDDDLANTVGTDINTNRTMRELTNAVGDAEKITNGTYFIGKLAGDTSASAGFELCTAKTVTALGDVSGICPEGPTLGGSYLLAGIARHARTTAVRADLAGKGNDPDALKITSYGIQLATNTPQLEIAVPNKPGQKIVIQPIYRLITPSGAFGGGALVDMKYVRQSVVGTRATGKVYINWEDSEQGGDYDQDMWGVLEWDIDSATNSVKITTNAVSASTANPQGFGYTIAGTTQDGPHFHSGILGFNFADTVTAQPANFAGCSNCQMASVASGQRGAQSVTYTLDATKSTSTGSLKDPLWYLAKYGGFDDRNRNGQLDANEWDIQNNLTGAPVPDGIPDTYFLVTNPLGLEAALERAFRGIAQQGSGTAVAASTGSIRTGSAIYTARFKTAEWSGQLSAFRLAANGSLLPEDWEASAKLPTPDKRVVLTYRNDATLRKGVPFRWPTDPANLGTSDIGKDLVDGLNTRPDPTAANDGRGADRLKYLRGDGALEGNALTSFRVRLNGKLGDIVNSSPAFVPAVPNDVVLDKTYVDFQKPFLTSPRTPMVYIAANDGMLHGFDASVSTVSPDGKTTTPSPTGGIERIAYVPSKTFTGLNQLTSPTYVHRYYVDGSPVVADAKVKGQWKTVLVGALGAGGRGIYALDVTNPPPAPASTDTDSTSIESTAAAKVLWEFNVDDDVPATGQPYGLGYVLGQPVIRKVASTSTGTERWAAIVSGGYNNTETVPGKGKGGDGKGYIYVIFLDGPSKNTGRTWEEGVDYIRLETTGDLTTPNGVAPPFVADVNGDGAADFIYAGDLLGNFWKFDISGANASLWNSSANRVVLFKTPSQPITAGAQGVFHPTSKGFLLLFGTGKYLELTDPKSPFTTQSFYAIWDKNDKPGSIGAQSVVASQNSLFQQVINTVATSTGTFRYITQPTGVKTTSPDWTTNMGWYMDFPDSATTGERSVFTPLVASRRLIFSTLVPSGSGCDFGGTSYVMIVNPVTGGEFDNAILDINNDGKFTTADSVAPGHFAIGMQSTVGIVQTPKMLLGGVPAGTTAGKDTTLLFNDNTGRLAGAGNRRAGLFMIGANGGMPPTPLGMGAGRDAGRATWREVVKK